MTLNIVKKHIYDSKVSYFVIAPVEIDCDLPFGEEVTLPGSIIVSPNHPGGYGKNQYCETTITFREGQKVVIDFLYFNLEAEALCKYDWLEVRDGPSAKSNLLGGSKLCGITSPNAMVSTGNTVTLVFKSDHNVVRSGFKIKAELGKIYCTG